MQLGLGGGCHWCTEAVFQHLRGVQHVAQGFIRSAPPEDSFSEAVLVDFDPNTITLADLIEIHLRTHASTSQHRMRHKYRSAIYIFSDQQQRDAEAILSRLQTELTRPLITLVLPFVGFRRSQERFLDYFKNNPEKPFCKRHIDPKLAKLRTEYSRLLRHD